MAQLPKNSGTRRQTVGIALWIAVLSVCFCLSVLLVPVSQAQEQDRILAGSGILYPSGYDVNTIGDIQGKIKETVIPTSGPVRLLLDSHRDTYIVLASPAWFWKGMDIDIPDGAEVVVHGSKSLGTDGNLYIIVQEIKIPSLQKTFAFRDDTGLPLWSGTQVSPTGVRGRGFDSPARGGIGGAPSGMGRGRR